MTPIVAISKLQFHFRSAPLTSAVQRFRDGFARRWAQVAQWTSKSQPACPVNEFTAGCPGALPGLNQRLVRNTWRLAGRRIPSTDGRLRLGGADTLDVCATPGEATRAIQVFACWLDYLAADGIGVGIQKLEGWRTCAIVDGVAVPIRIRERMHRLPSGNRLSVAIERWLGGRIPTVLAPSGRLELQLLRMGVSFASFPVERQLQPSTMEQVARAIRGMAQRQVEYRQRMHAAAIAETTTRKTGIKPGTRAKKAALPEAQPAMPHAAAYSVQPDALAGLAALSALGSAQIRELLQAMEKLAANSQDSRSLMEREPAIQMSESVVCLMQAITGSKPQLIEVCEEAEVASTVTMISDAERKEGSPVSAQRRRRSRKVA